MVKSPFCKTHKNLISLCFQGTGAHLRSLLSLLMECTDGISAALFAGQSCNRHRIAELFVQKNISKKKWGTVFKALKANDLK